MSNEETKTIKQEVDALGGSLLADIHTNYARLENTEYENTSCVFAINNNGEHSGVAMCGNGKMIRQTLLHICTVDEDVKDVVIDVARMLAFQSLAISYKSAFDEDEPQEKSSDDAG